MTNLAIPNTAAASSVAASTTAFSNASSAGTSGSANSLTQANFLQLLTAQLQYQSPTSPADPTQLASEFAQISEVDGINQLNTEVSGLQSSSAAGQLAQASSLVGHQVAVAGNNLTPDASGNASGAFELSGPAQSATVTVLAPSGAVAGTLDLGALSGGQQSFNWNGGTAGTQYTYQVNAVSAAGTAVPATPYTVYNVQGVNISGTSPTLNVEGSATPLPISSIQTVLGETAA